MTQASKPVNDTKIKQALEEEDLTASELSMKLNLPIEEVYESLVRMENSSEARIVYLGGDGAMSKRRLRRVWSVTQ